MADDAEDAPRPGLTLDAQARRTVDRSALLGGNPFRVLRLSDSGQRRLDEWLAGDGPRDSAGVALYSRLVDGALAHPDVRSAADLGLLAAVVPVLDDLRGLEALLPLLRDALGPDRSIVVVDDGSQASGDIAALADQQGAVVLRHETNRGPSAARNTGWRWCVDTVPVDRVLFVDADVTVGHETVATLVAHLDADPNVAVVAPRISPAPGTGPLNAYEAVNSPLDLGDTPALVQPKTRVSYVPSAVMLVRASVLESLNGFDEDMRVGEDVDFVWRATEAGLTVRYEPRAPVTHRNRPTLRAIIKQRFAYGTSAAMIERRHPTTIFPVEISVTHAPLWLLAAFGGMAGKAAGAVGYGLSVIELDRKMSLNTPDSIQRSEELIRFAHVGGLRWLADAATRAWAPLLMASGKGRRLYATALVVPAAVDYVAEHPPLDPFRFFGLRATEHSAYCAGLWSGAWRERSARVLLPRWRWR